MSRERVPPPAPCMQPQASRTRMSRMQRAGRQKGKRACARDRSSSTSARAPATRQPQAPSTPFSAARDPRRPLSPTHALQRRSRARRSGGTPMRSGAASSTRRGSGRPPLGGACRGKEPGPGPREACHGGSASGTGGAVTTRPAEAACLHAYQNDRLSVNRSGRSGWNCACHSVRPTEGGFSSRAAADGAKGRAPRIESPWPSNAGVIWYCDLGMRNHWEVSTTSSTFLHAESGHDAQLALGEQRGKQLLLADGTMVGASPGPVQHQRGRLRQPQGAGPDGPRRRRARTGSRRTSEAVSWLR